MGLESATVDAILPRQQKWLFLLPRQQRVSAVPAAGLPRQQKRQFPLPRQRSDRAVPPSPAAFLAAAAETAFFRGCQPTFSRDLGAVHRSRAFFLRASFFLRSSIFAVASPLFHAISVPFSVSGLFPSVDTFSPYPGFFPPCIRFPPFSHFRCRQPTFSRDLSAVLRIRAFSLRGYVFPVSGLFSCVHTFSSVQPFSLSPAHFFTRSQCRSPYPGFFPPWIRFPRIRAFFLRGYVFLRSAIFAVASPRFHTISVPFSESGLFPSVDTFSPYPGFFPPWIRFAPFSRFPCRQPSFPRDLSADVRIRAFSLRGYVFPVSGHFSSVQPFSL